VNPAEFGFATGAALLAVAHAWAGTRYLLPAVQRLPEYRRIANDAAWARRLLYVGWLMGSLGLVGFGALIRVVDVLDSRDAIQRFIFGLMLLLTASPMILGTYLGSLLRSRTQHLGTWFTILLWIVLAFVVTIAWYAAQA
jgi:hypothetical protein